MKSDNVEFLKSLIQVDSINPPGNEHHVAELFIDRCRSVGWKYRVTEIDEARSNLEVVLEGSDSRLGSLMLSGHMDTVKIGQEKWMHEPLSGEIVDGKMYGRGTSDMKSGLAAMFIAMEQIRKEGIRLKRDVVFLATAGEEVDNCGAFDYMKNVGMAGVDALVIGEPTNEKIAIGHKGALWLEIMTFGRTAHGAMPEEGINAVEWMAKAIGLVEELKVDWRVEKAPLGRSSVSANRIEGGIQTNVIPDACLLEIDIRSVAPQNHETLLEDLRVRLEQLFSTDRAPKFQITKQIDLPSVLTDAGSPLIQHAFEIKGDLTGEVHGMPYYTDASVLNPESAIETLVYGPGDEKLAHQPNECVDIEAYERAIRFYKELILKYAG